MRPRPVPLRIMVPRGIPRDFSVVLDTILGQGLRKTTTLLQILQRAKFIVLNLSNSTH